MRFAASLVGPDAASDLVSEVVVATLQHRTLESLQNPKAYLMQATLNRAKSRGRGFSRERAAIARLSAATPTVTELDDPDPGPMQAVAGLPPQQRAAVFLVYWEDLAHAEAARLLGVRPATLRRYLHLARRTLREHLDE